MPDDPAFARLVSLACHDLRTPLVTVGGFARTVPRVADVNAQGQRFLDLIVEAATEISDLIDDLSRAARIESGRFSPDPERTRAGRVAGAAATLIGPGVAVAGGDGDLVRVDVDVTARALAGLGRLVTRFGAGVPLALAVDGRAVALAPVPAPAAAVLSGAELSDFRAAVALRVLRALGAAAALEEEAFVVRLPT
jgi:His Kinase A (phospho-acceptor) domain